MGGFPDFSIYAMSGNPPYLIGGKYQAGMFISDTLKNI